MFLPHVQAWRCSNHCWPSALAGFVQNNVAHQASPEAGAAGAAATAAELDCIHSPPTSLSLLPPPLLNYLQPSKFVVKSQTLPSPLLGAIKAAGGSSSGFQAPCLAGATRSATGRQLGLDSLLDCMGVLTFVCGGCGAQRVSVAFERRLGC